MVLRFPNHNTPYVITLILTLFLISGKMFAQSDELKPGIYAVVGEEYIPLEYVYGGSSSSEIAFSNGSQICPAVVRYKGTTAGIYAADTFVYVLNPTQKVLYSPFNKGMNPNSMGVLPLYVNEDKQQREYAVSGKSLKELLGLDFEWKRLNGNSFEIHIPGLAPGEYGIVFCRGKLGPFDYTRLHCFTISNKIQQ